MDKKEIIKGIINDGQGGILGNIKSGFSNMFGGNKPTIEQPKTYNIRGINTTDDDLNEAANILYAEVSNRPAERQSFEVNNILNTAINRSLSPGLDKGKTLKEVLQRRAQYQGYAPEGTIGKDGKVVPSQYQKVKSGVLDARERAKLQTIKDAIQKAKDPSFADTTGGSNFYVHASDGSMWVGKTQKEALANAKAHEKKNKIAVSKFGTKRGMPAEVAMR